MHGKGSASRYKLQNILAYDFIFGFFPFITRMALSMCPSPFSYKSRATAEKNLFLGAVLPECKIVVPTLAGLLQNFVRGVVMVFLPLSAT